MLVALAPIIMALIGGSSFTAAAAALSIPQWLAIGDAVLKALPEEIKVAKDLHGVLGSVIAMVLKSGNPGMAPVAAREWFAANAETAMRLQPGISSES